jgi:hypothetical protein
MGKGGTFNRSLGVPPRHIFHECEGSEHSARIPVQLDYRKAIIIVKREKKVGLLAEIRLLSFNPNAGES